ncbi:ABC transporter ATP-binding protein [Paracraurococcus ruber]|uniref:Nitrate/sulfonate/bicarbonate ABC transporter ATP-binding protein n=1 Tax=Paracraurococcus ruber TaxID=77675 RepID=A0ABS1CSN6_9PROT|nr:ABC transporter ATP-binding protein [Paracraurococcus ruber]MBK1657385.1 nitrate/sulfonate/bicarbonate ABC transporter ATP-binding protein [Paracraurococcus ruber]TDG32404.1 ABC transporter ATP-binding protein [Paracraurococcus ruber]
MSAASLVSLRGVAKRYATGTLAVRGIDLDIAPGDFVALLGPSGCGKSTLLRMVAGLAEPTGGRIAWPGGQPSARDIGFVFQEPTLMPWATAQANVALPLELAGMPRAEAASRAASMLARVGLQGFEKAYPRALSGGMKMRVSLARALVTKPRLLLMDEPFAALDEITRFRLNNDLLELWTAERFTVVFVTHSVFESVYLAQRIVVMAPRPGRIHAELAVDAPAPRGEEFRTSADYAAHCREVSQALAAAMAPAAA